MEGQNDKQSRIAFESLRILINRWKNGTFAEIIDDWKWIFHYSARYKRAIIFYVILGIVSTSLGLVSTVAGKYMIDIITGYKMEKFWILALLMLGSAAFNIIFGSVINRITTKLSISINQDIQADIFDKIIDADWMSISQYSNGDILNRFNGDVGTVSSNAINWLPSIILAVYNFVATFLVIFYYDKLMAVIALCSAPLQSVINAIILS